MPQCFIHRLIKTRSLLFLHAPRQGLRLERSLLTREVPVDKESRVCGTCLVTAGWHALQLTASVHHT